MSAAAGRQVARRLLAGGHGSRLVATATTAAAQQHQAGEQWGHRAAAEQAAPAWAGRLAAVAAVSAVAACRAEVAQQEAAEEPGPSPPQAGKEWSLFSKEMRTETFFKYEKRLREHSEVDKIFDYFSTAKDSGGHKAMTEMDLMQSVVPVYPMGDVRTGFLDGDKRKPARQRMGGLGSTFDADGNGMICFSEYIFFLQLMSISIEDFAVALAMLDVDGSGTLTKEEMLAALMWGTDKPRERTRTGMGNLDGCDRTNFLPALFGKDGKRSVPLQKVMDFLSSLHDDLGELEFNHYDEKRKGSITGREFALAAIAAMPVGDMDNYLARVKDLPERLLKAPVSKAEFKAFAKLPNYASQFKRASRFWKERQGVMTLDDFARALGGACHCKLSAAQLEVLYILFQPQTPDKQTFPARFIRMLELRSMKERARTTLAPMSQTVKEHKPRWGLPRFQKTAEE